MSLVTAALTLRRKVYASLPWGYRLADFLTKLASVESDGFGQAVYGLFLMYGVTDMPPIKGEPAENHKPTSPKEIDRKVPHGYGSDYGGLVYKTLLSKFKNVDFVSDVMMEGVLKLTTNATLGKSLEGKTLVEARKIFHTTVYRIGLNMVRSKGREVSMTDDEGLERIIEDPNAWDELGKEVPEVILKHVQQDLATIDPRLLPDLPLYFKLLTEGYNNSEIVRDRMLPFLEETGMSYANWKKRYEQKIKSILEKHLKKYQDAN
jgi:hypothetical protein